MGSRPSPLAPFSPPAGRRRPVHPHICGGPDTLLPPPPTVTPSPIPPANSNATLIGASANIVTATMLDKSGHHFSFVSWLKIGVPVTVATVAAANV